MVGFVGALSLKSYDVISNLHTSQYGNFQANYWGQIVGIDTLTHYVATPNIDYSAQQVGPVVTAHPSISSPMSIAITNLVSGAAFKNRTNVPIIWQNTGNIPFVNIDLSTNGGSTWLPVARSIPNVGQFSWYNNLLGNTTVILRISNPSNQTITSQVTLSVSPAQ